jgi:hypothetical protein
MKFYLKSIIPVAIIAIFALTFSCKKDNKIPSDKVAITETVAAVVIDKYNVFCSGVVGSDNGYTVTARGFCWSSTNISPTLEDEKNIVGAGAGSFIDTIYTFKPSTRYYLRAYATNAAGTAYGSTLSFETAAGELPKLNTFDVSEINSISAKSGGEITDNCGTPITARGVIWGITSDITIDNAAGKTTDGLGIGTFTSDLQGLVQGTHYYVKAYATNGTGTGYGDTKDFETPGPPEVITLNDFHDVMGNSAIVNGSIVSDGGFPVISSGLCWSTSSNPTTSDNKNNLLNATISGLVPNTLYYARAYATNSAGTGYGNEISFNSGYLMGTDYAGGLVFYNDGTGHGYCCAQTDFEASWGCDGIFMNTKDSLGYGISNTYTIVSNCNETGIAARRCYDLVYNSYSDWFLPSYDEFLLMGNNLHVKNLGNFKNGEYWCSSEYSYNPANLAVNFYLGNQGGGYFNIHISNKTYQCWVRPARKF